MLIGGERTAMEFDPFLQEDRFDGKRATRGPLAHGAMAHDHLHGSPGSCEADFAAQAGAAMDLRHSDSRKA